MLFFYFWDGHLNMIAWGEAITRAAIQAPITISLREFVTFSLILSARVNSYIKYESWSIFELDSSVLLELWSTIFWEESLPHPLLWISWSPRVSYSLWTGSYFWIGIPKSVIWQGPILEGHLLISYQIPWLIKKHFLFPRQASLARI